MEEDLTLLLKRKGSLKLLATLLLVGGVKEDDSKEESINDTDEICSCSTFELWHREVSNRSSNDRLENR